jgi:hypothetical protein
VSNIFTDDKVKVVSVNSIDPSSAGMGDVVLAAPMKSIIDESNQTINVTLHSKFDDSTLQMSVPTSLHFKEIQLDSGLIKEYSNFLLKFYMAKEIMNVRAFDMVSAYMVDNTFYTEYEIPEDDRTRKAIQASAMMSGIGEMSSSFMADMWAHFLMVPNYLIALERDRFSEREIKGNELSTFDLAANVFQEEDVLIRNPEGIYEWTKDTDKFFNTWIDLSIAGFKTFGLR